MPDARLTPDKPSQLARSESRAAYTHEPPLGLADHERPEMTEAVAVGPVGGAGPPSGTTPSRPRHARPRSRSRPGHLDRLAPRAVRLAGHERLEAMEPSPARPVHVARRARAVGVAGARDPGPAHAPAAARRTGSARQAGGASGDAPPAGLLSGCAGIRAENVAEVVEAEGGTEGRRLARGLWVGQREQRAELGRGASAESVCRPGDERAAELPEAVPAHGGG